MNVLLFPIRPAAAPDVIFRPAGSFSASRRAITK
jgi:hypothetical protein